MFGSEESEMGENETKWKRREEDGVEGGSGVFIEEGKTTGARAPGGWKGTGYRDGPN